MAQRAQTFQTLKAPCVALSDVAIKHRAAKSTTDDVVRALQRLEKTISDLPKSALDLDSKLAEYVFFPLSHVFRNKNDLSLRALEIASRILKSLLETGWRKDIASELGVQLLILLTFLAGGAPDQKDSKTSEDIQAVAFQCQSLVFTSLASSAVSKTSVLSTKNVPAIGHAVTVMLEGLKQGASNEVQLAAIVALQSFHNGLATREVSASFLPGLVSSLSLVLTPTTKTRRTYWVLVRSIGLLGDAITLVLADDVVESDPKSKNTLVQREESLMPELDAAWLKATGAQVKLALANVIKLRQHGRVEVREALNDLCFGLLDKCRHSLSNCVQMLLQTTITLQHSLDQNEASNAIEALIKVDDGLADAMRSNLYDWLVSLPRIMQSNDDDAKTRVANQIESSLHLLVGTAVEMSVIDNIMLESLRDSIVNAVHLTNHTQELDSADASGPTSSSSLDLITTSKSESTANFRSVLSGHKHIEGNIDSLRKVIKELSKRTQSLSIARQSLEFVRMSSNSNERLASFYIGLNIIQSYREHESVVSDFLDVSAHPDSTDDIQEELYSIALSLLSNGVDASNDWRLQALSLESITFYASQQGPSFRPDLVDALYPIVHLLGSNISPLRQHATVALESLANSCSYADAKDLLVSNADYLVNAIGLKINSFDIEPQAPQVLAMMVRLSGPRLIPYLSDIVDGMFEALEAFHGYAKLTEVLFHTLNAVVEVGVTAPALSIEDVKVPSHEKREIRPTSVDEVVKLLEIKRTKQRKIEKASIDLPDRTPRRPWGKPKSSQAKDLIEEIDDDDGGGADDTEEEDEGPPRKDSNDPLTPTYKLIQRITSLTQHHLPSASPSLRTSLLSLLRTSLPYLAIHEESFLPLVHTLWPVLLPRLSDPEAYVVAATLDVIAAMCKGAGDFIATRVDTLWPIIRRIHMRILDDRASHERTSLARKALTSGIAPNDSIASGSSLRTLDRSELAITSTGSVATSKMSPHLQQRGDSRTPYVSTTATLLRSSLTGFLLALIAHVRLSDAVFTEACVDMLRSALVATGEQAESVREVVGRRNPDLVWLLRETERAKSSRDRGETVKDLVLPKNVPGAPRFRQVVF